ncbi:MAG: glycerate kinase, partial [Clostridia bacterium]|nr:glycerate kinase [Clostridia bacterium]
KAVIESALASGLALVKDRELDPMTATSYGTGELILRAAHEGAAEISVCLGGSATNDGGLGMARAIGVKFLKDDGAEAVSACELKDIVSIDTSALDRFVSDAKITVVCDVDNPLTGPSGATMTFGPQKGAGEEKLALLEEGMLNLEKLLNAKAGRSVCSEPGSGAAGGMGAMLMALLNAGHENGAEAILALSDIDGKLKDAVFAITGEGRIDSTSLHGKAVGAVLAHAERAKVPTAIIAGCMGEGAEEVLNKAEFAEFTGSEEDALRYFEAAACRLADKLAERLRK